MPKEAIVVGGDPAELPLDEARKRIIVALYGMELDAVLSFSSKLRGEVGMIMLHSTFLAELNQDQADILCRELEGRLAIEVLVLGGGGSAAYEVGEKVSKYRPRLVTVSADFGAASMESVVGVRGSTEVAAVLLPGVMTDEECLGQLGMTVEEALRQLSRSAFKAEVQSLVCAPEYVSFVCGVRGARSAKKIAVFGGQGSAESAGDAIRAGANMVILGREITDPPNGEYSLDAVERIATEIARVL